ncbi:MAG: VOC family protein [Acidobacteriota bacterium]
MHFKCEEASLAQFEPYLIFDGNCAEAIAFYQRTLSAKIEFKMTYGEAPDAAKMPPGGKDRILHSRLLLGDRALMASDGPLGQEYAGMHNVFVTLHFPTVVEAQRVFAAFGESGHVIMPMANTFWVEMFGMVADRFGASWMISGGKSSM